MMDMPKMWNNELMIAFQLYNSDDSFLTTLFDHEMAIMFHIQFNISCHTMDISIIHVAQ
jgi:hypothetical protein